VPESWCAIGRARDGHVDAQPITLDLDLEASNSLAQ